MWVNLALAIRAIGFYATEQCGQIAHMPASVIVTRPSGIILLSCVQVLALALSFPVVVFGQLKLSVQHFGDSFEGGIEKPADLGHDNLVVLEVDSEFVGQGWIAGSIDGIA
jgi:hypothetical protein